MKVIIAGSRTFCKIPKKSRLLDASGWDKYDQDYGRLQTFIQEWRSKFGAITEVVSGTAEGVDTAGERWAAEEGLTVRRFRPDWAKQGRKAGVMRNLEMAKYADGALVVIENGSKGSWHMAKAMKGKNLLVIQIKDGNERTHE